MQRVETACVKKPFRKFDCEDEQKNVAMTREVSGAKENLPIIFFFLRWEITELV